MFVGGKILAGEKPCNRGKKLCPTLCGRQSPRQLTISDIQYMTMRGKKDLNTTILLLTVQLQNEIRTYGVNFNVSFLILTAADVAY